MNNQLRMKILTKKLLSIGERIHFTSCELKDLRLAHRIASEIEDADHLKDHLSSLVNKKSGELKRLKQDRERAEFEQRNLAIMMKGELE